MNVASIVLLQLLQRCQPPKGVLHPRLIAVSSAIALLNARCKILLLLLCLNSAQRLWPKQKANVALTPLYFSPQSSSYTNCSPGEGDGAESPFSSADLEKNDLSDQWQ